MKKNYLLLNFIMLILGSILFVNIVIPDPSDDFKALSSTGPIINPLRTKENPGPTFYNPNKPVIRVDKAKIKK